MHYTCMNHIAMQLTDKEVIGLREVTTATEEVILEILLTDVIYNHNNGDISSQ